MLNKVISVANSEDGFQRALLKFMRTKTVKSVQFSTCEYKDGIMYSALVLYTNK